LSAGFLANFDGLEVAIGLLVVFAINSLLKIMNRIGLHQHLAYRKRM